MVSISHWGMFAVEGYEGYYLRHVDCLKNGGGILKDGKSYSYLLYLDDK